MTKAPTFAQTQRGYANLWAQARVLPAWRARAERAADRVRAGMACYAAVEAATGVPWQFVGVLHHMESGCRFDTHLHNGDPLTRRTTHVPAGRPRAAPRDGRAYTWEESAIDALTIKGLIGLKNWSIPFMCYAAEAYNGWGYLWHGVNSCYLWSGTTLQQAGRYIADGVWDPNAWSEQVGIVAMLKILMEGEAVDTLATWLQQFDKLAPALVQATSGKYATVAGMVLREVLGKAIGEDVPDHDAAVLNKLQGLDWGKLVAVLTDVNGLLKDVVGGPTASPAPVFAPTPAPTPPTLAIEPQPEPTVLDVLLGTRLTGYKTYLVIAVAGAVNVAAVLGVAPGILTPEHVAAINTLLGALGGAALVSKIERLAKYATVLRR